MMADGGCRRSTRRFAIVIIITTIVPTAQVVAAPSEAVDVYLVERMERSICARSGSFLQSFFRQPLRLFVGIIADEVRGQARLT